VQEVLVGSFFEELPTQLIGNKAYDSYPRDETLASECGIELIVANRRGRKRLDPGWTQQLSRYSRRWKVERLFAWMHNFRRLVTDGNTTSRTFSASSTSPAFTCPMHL
jgi:transposase